jgi:hypothetical protein
VVAVPDAHALEQHDAHDGGEREPGGMELAVRDHHQRHEQRPDRLARVAADLEQGLREAVAPARREPGHARSLGMEDGAADADQGRCQQHGAEAAGERQDQHAEEGRGHAEGQREGLRMLVAVEPDQRLQDRGRELEDERDDADVHEVEGQRLLHQRIDREQHRLHRVVEEMGPAHREQDRQHGGARRPRRSDAHAAHRHHVIPSRNRPSLGPASYCLNAATTSTQHARQMLTLPEGS